DEVLERLAELRAADLIALDRDLEHAYLFKHMATQEVAYESLPFGLRARLHGLVGTWYERSDPDGVDRRLDLLAHHFWLSDDDERKRLYLGRAADAARTAYANDSAISYLERLVPLLDGASQIEAQLKLAKVLQVVGELGRAEAVAGEARSAAEVLGDPLEAAWADASLAETAKRQSRYEAATARLDAALATFQAAQENAGVGDMLHLAGVVAQLQGDYPAAKSRYEDSRSVREEIGDVAGVATTDGNLAILRVRRRLPRRAGDQRPGAGAAAPGRRPARHRDRRDERRRLPYPQRRPRERPAAPPGGAPPVARAGRPGDGRPLHVHARQCRAGPRRPVVRGGSLRRRAPAPARARRPLLADVHRRGRRGPARPGRRGGTGVRAAG